MVRASALFALAPWLASAGFACAQAPSAPAAAAPVNAPFSQAGAFFENPLKENGADPWLTYSGGWYYFTTTESHGIYMRAARHFAELKNAEDRLIWSDAERTRFRDMWAPECHLLPDEMGRPRWYLYYTASDGIEPHHRMFVAESNGSTPLGPYTFKARLATDPKNEFYAIDGTVLRLPDGRMYFIWCGRPSPAGQGLFISRMANAWTLTGPRVALPADGFGCPNVREGPEILQHGGKVFLIYSACDAATPEYKMGYLWANPESDLLNPGSWKQNTVPAFAPAPQNNVWGPGHCFFFKSPDGKEDWIIYHAKTTNRYTYHDRTTRAQRFTWKSDGTPDFGIPLPVGTRLAVPSGE